MNITFLIGNGFDIGIGLKTGYEDFYNEYCKINADDSLNIRDFKRMLQQINNDEEAKRITGWADFEKAFGVHSLDFKHQLKETAKANYTERFEDFVYKFNEYLEKEELNADFQNRALIGETMKNAIENYFNIRAADKIEIENYFKKFSPVRNYDFISFNYTRTLDKCVKILKSTITKENEIYIGNVVHIHGYIDENMIMGVNDPSQILGPELANDNDIIEELVKPSQNDITRSNYENLAIAALSSSDIICTYGMSIGDTDKKWWTMIANWLLQKDNRVLIILKHEKNYNRRFTFSQRGLIDATINKFLSFALINDADKENIKKRIFIGINNDVFSMNLRKNDIPPENGPDFKQIEEIENNAISFERIDELIRT